VDDDTVIDATKCGNVARFINHCCAVSVWFTNGDGQMTNSLSLAKLQCQNYYSR
jgi:SET domain-containing protein